MRTGPTSAALLSLAIALTACAPEVGPLSEEDIAAVMNLGLAYQQDVLVGDADGIAGLYTEDGVEMPPHGPAREGREAIRSAYADMGATVTDFNVTVTEVDGLNGLAYERGTWSATMVREGEEESVTDHGTYLCVARKQSNDVWLWEAMTWNSGVPIPEEE